MANSNNNNVKINIRNYRIFEDANFRAKWIILHGENHAELTDVAKEKMSGHLLEDAIDKSGAYDMNLVASQAERLKKKSKAKVNKVQKVVRFGAVKVLYFKNHLKNMVLYD